MKGTFGAIRGSMLVVIASALVGGCPQSGQGLFPAIGGTDYSGIYSGDVIHTVTDTVSHTQNVSSLFFSLRVNQQGLPVYSDGNEWQVGDTLSQFLGSFTINFTVSELSASGSTALIRSVVTGSSSVPFVGTGILTLEYTDAGTVKYSESFMVSDNVEYIRVDNEGVLSK